MIAIDTDAHAPGQLEWQRNGCEMAVAADVPLRAGRELVEHGRTAWMDRLAQRRSSLSSEVEVASQASRARTPSPSEEVAITA